MKNPADILTMSKNVKVYNNTAPTKLVGLPNSKIIESIKPSVI